MLRTSLRRPISSGSVENLKSTPFSGGKAPNSTWRSAGCAVNTSGEAVPGGTLELAELFKGVSYDLWVS